MQPADWQDTGNEAFGEIPFESGISSGGKNLAAGSYKSMEKAKRLEMDGKERQDR